MKTLSLFICLSLVSGFAFSQWIQQYPHTPGNTLNSVYFTDAKTGYAVGSGGIILKTSNGGENWTYMESGTGENLYSIFFTDANTGYVVGGCKILDDYGPGCKEQIILKTNDGGTTWSVLWREGGIPLFSVHFIDANTGYAGGAGILKTIDARITWNVITNKGFYSDFFFTNINTGYAVGCDWYNLNGPKGIILKTTDGGTTWTEISIGIPEEQINSVFFTDVNTGYAAGEGGTIIKTINGGASWNMLSSGTAENVNSVLFTDVNTGYAVIGDRNGYPNSGGNILKTINGGETWTNLSYKTNEILISVFFTDANTGYVVGGGGTILKTTNGGGFPTVVENVSQESTFTVYPNPVKDFVVFDLPNSSESATVELYDIQGRKVVYQKLTETKQIAVGNLPKGLYLYRLNDGEKMYSGKLVVE